MTEVNSVVCLSITNQRETSLIWDRRTSKPIANAAFGNASGELLHVMILKSRDLVK